MYIHLPLYWHYVPSSSPTVIFASRRDSQKVITSLISLFLAGEANSFSSVLIRWILCCYSHLGGPLQVGELAWRHRTEDLRPLYSGTNTSLAPLKTSGLMCSSSVTSARNPGCSFFFSALHLLSSLQATAASCCSSPSACSGTTLL